MRVFPGDTARVIPSASRSSATKDSLTPEERTLLDPHSITVENLHHFGRNGRFILHHSSIAAGLMSAAELKAPIASS